MSFTEDLLEPDNGEDRNEDWLYQGISFDRPEGSTNIWDDTYNAVLKDIEKRAKNES